MHIKIKAMKLFSISLFVVLALPSLFAFQAHDQNIAYTHPAIVVSSSVSYISVQNVPAGTTITSTTYWTPLLGTAPSTDPGTPPTTEPSANDSNLSNLTPPDDTVTGTIQIFSISTRAYFGTNGMSGSLTMAGNSNEPKYVMFRVKGPSMNIDGVKLPNPSIDVKSRSLNETTWTDEFVSQDFGDHSSATGPYSHRNTGNNLEPMVVSSFTPNVYGCVVGSEDGGEGNAIIELYSMNDDNSSSYFSSLSTRGYYGANGMSGSVRLVGTGKKKIMFRIKGPSMNIDGTKLSDPNITVLKLLDSGWEEILKSSTFGSAYTFENSNYTNANLTSSYTHRHTGNNLEPMVVLELSEGTYSCVVGSDIETGEGNAIIEIYSVD
jgi:hypothetical protein